MDLPIKNSDFPVRYVSLPGRVPPVTAGITVSGWRPAPPHLHGIGHLLHAQRRCAGPGRRLKKKHGEDQEDYDWLVVDLLF